MNVPYKNLKNGRIFPFVRYPYLVALCALRGTKKSEVRRWPAPLGA